MDVQFPYDVIGGPRDGGVLMFDTVVFAGNYVAHGRGNKIDLYRAWFNCRTQRVALVFERTEIRVDQR